jgi:hypothetical protein
MPTNRRGCGLFPSAARRPSGKHDSPFSIFHQADAPFFKDSVSSSLFAFTRKEGGVSNQYEVPSLELAMQSSSPREFCADRDLQDLAGSDASRASGDGAFWSHQSLASFLDMNNGLIALLDEEDRTSIVVGAGWSEATAREHFERLPEQAVGQIVGLGHAFGGAQYR